MGKQTIEELKKDMQEKYQAYLEAEQKYRNADGSKLIIDNYLNKYICLREASMYMYVKKASTRSSYIIFEGPTYLIDYGYFEFDKTGSIEHYRQTDFDKNTGLNGDIDILAKNDFMKIVKDGIKQIQTELNA